MTHVRVVHGATFIPTRGVAATVTADIRLVDDADAPAIQAIYEPHVRDSATSFEETPPTTAEIRRRIEEQSDRYPWLVCEVDGDVVGYAYAGQHRSRDAYRWSIDCSVYVDDDYHRHGVARGLYESLFAVLRLQGFQNAYAGTTLPNPASVGFHESMGFERVGVYERVGYKQGAWHDVLWLSKSLGEHPDDPDPLLELSEVRGDEEWEAALDAGIEYVRL